MNRNRGLTQRKGDKKIVGDISGNQKGKKHQNVRENQEARDGSILGTW